MSRAPTVGAVLCGGRSTRMGRDKATLPVAGRAMAHWVADAMSALDLQAVVALGARAEVGLPIVDDEPGVSGPMAALLAGLRTHAPATDERRRADRVVRMPDRTRRAQSGSVRQLA